ncbi:MAG: hypothetical protein NTW87_36340, partial [Planctomycetota bacterium]|nr:hypothetical protein [Planctomycetota bacterium]
VCASLWLSEAQTHGAPDPADSPDRAADPADTHDPRHLGRDHDTRSPGGSVGPTEGEPGDMAAKEILYDENARRSLERGANMVADSFAERALNATSTLWGFKLRQGTVLDRFPKAIQEVVAKNKDKFTDAQLNEMADAWEQQSSIPVLACGPFVNPGGGPNTKLEHAPEKAHVAGTLKPTDTYDDNAAQPDPKGKDVWKAAGKVGWKEAALSDTALDFVNVWPAARDREQDAGYVALWVKSPKAMDVMLGCGSDDGIKIWVNGKPVHDNGASRGSALDQDKPKAALQDGWNAILIKVTNGGGGWALNFRVAAPDGMPIPGLQFSAKPQ